MGLFPSEVSKLSFLKDPSAGGKKNDQKGS